MTEPTIDEMLAYLNRHTGEYGWDQVRAAIIAILEQHRYPACAPMEVGHELAAIRAFVERVEKRLPDYDTGRTADAMLKAYRRAVYDELEAMEEGAKQ